MSLFTNDVDTISDALNNSFAVVIQTFIQVVGTLLMLFILNWRLSLLVAVGYVGMFWYINFPPSTAVPTMPSSKAAWASWTLTLRK